MGDRVVRTKLRKVYESNGNNRKKMIFDRGCMRKRGKGVRGEGGGSSGCFGIKNWEEGGAWGGGEVSRCFFSRGWGLKPFIIVSSLFFFPVTFGAVCDMM